MRLAYLMSRYPAPSEVFIQREITGLRRLGAEVVAVSVRRGAAPLSEVARAEAARTEALLPTTALALVRAHLAAARRPLVWLGSLVAGFVDAPPGRRLMQILYWGEAVLLWDVLRRKQVNHVHVHFAGNASDIALIATRLGARAGMGPSSFSIHLHGPTDFFDVRRNRIEKKARAATGVICVSDYARSQVLAWLSPREWDRVQTVRYGVPAIDVPVRIRSAADPLRILTVARLAGVKGLPVLLEALEQMTTEGIDARLDVVGDGPLRDELSELADSLGIQERIRWHGALGQDCVADLYAKADVFCLPSFAEGLPVVLMEAMAASLPVVATAITGVPEAVRHEVDGLLVPPGRPEELAAALSRLARDPEQAVRLGASGRARIERDLREDVTVERMYRALGALVPSD